MVSVHLATSEQAVQSAGSCSLHPSFEIRHMQDRCGTDALMGSMCVLRMMRLMLEPFESNGS
jgi:hypothetical protein